jgi:hypothetical protein
MKVLRIVPFHRSGICVETSAAPAHVFGRIVGRVCGTIFSPVRNAAMNRVDVIATSRRYVSNLKFSAGYVKKLTDNARSSRRLF